MEVAIVTIATSIATAVLLRVKQQSTVSKQKTSLQAWSDGWLLASFLLRCCCLGARLIVVFQQRYRAKFGELSSLQFTEYILFLASCSQTKAPIV
jgi:hypothetical protein